MAINQRYLKLALVAFIDLLGFSARVEALTDEDDFERLEHDVGRVQAWFDHNSSEKIVKESHKLKEKSVLAFSDCIVVCVSAMSKLAKHEGDFDVLMSEIASFAMAQGRCAVNGIFLRGAVDFGVWYRRKDTLISPAMVNAYHKERQACVPMIALTDRFYRHLSEHQHRNFYHKTADPIPRILRRFDDLPNGTAHYFIDYMPICLESLDGSISTEDQEAYAAADTGTRDRMRNEAYWRDCHTWADWHRESIRKAYAAAADDSIRAKYTWLASYHDNAVERFFRTAPPELLIGRLGSTFATPG